MILTGWDAAVARWVGDRLGIEDFGQYTALGIVRGDDLIAGVVYNQFRKQERSIEASIAAVNPRWASRTTLRVIFAYPFQQLHCIRITAITSAKNQPARAFLCRLGFVQEGVMRRAFRNEEDAVIHGLLADECRWL